VGDVAGVTPVELREPFRAEVDVALGALEVSSS
jgi:hypothetical protein